MSTERYGSAYWCIKTPISESGEIYVMADNASVNENGDLMMIGGFREEGQTEPRDGYSIPLLALAAGQWTAFYAASCIDGGAVAVEHWKGEVNQRPPRRSK